MRIGFHKYNGFYREGGPLIRVYHLGFVSIETISWKFARLVQSRWADIVKHVKEIAA